MPDDDTTGAAGVVPRLDLRRNTHRSELGANLIAVDSSDIAPRR